MGCVDCKDYITSLGLQDVYDKYWKDKTIPLFGVIELTYHCNFRCVHCYAMKQHSAPFLSYQQITALIDELVDAGTLVLTLSGGDPLTHPKFREIYRYIRQKGIIVEVFTNGALINSEIIELFKEYPPINVDITIYGASEDTYEAVTGSRKGYSSVYKNIQHLKEAGIHFTLKTCVIKENARDLEKIRTYAEGINADFRYSFDIAPEILGDASTREHMLSSEDIVAYEKRDFKRAKAWSQQKLAVIDEVPYYELPVFNCKTGRFTFCISAEGYLSGCIHDRSNLILLQPGNFYESWLKLNKRIQSVMITPEYPCASCEYLPFCNTCPADAQREYGSPFKVSPHQCALAKLRYKTFVKGDNYNEI